MYVPICNSWRIHTSTYLPTLPYIQPYQDEPALGDGVGGAVRRLDRHHQQGVRAGGGLICLFLGSGWEGGLLSSLLLLSPLSLLLWHTFLSFSPCFLLGLGLYEYTHTHTPHCTWSRPRCAAGCPSSTTPAHRHRSRRAGRPPLFVSNWLVRSVVCACLCLQGRRARHEHLSPPTHTDTHTHSLPPTRHVHPPAPLGGQLPDLQQRRRPSVAATALLVGGYIEVDSVTCHHRVHATRYAIILSSTCHDNTCAFPTWVGGGMGGGQEVPDLLVVDLHHRAGHLDWRKGAWG